MEIFHGDIVYAASPEALTVHENAYILVESGIVKEICQTVPEQYAALAVTDHGRGLIIPAFSDLHVHAAQYAQRGLAMDLLLSDWLDQYTFPQEAKFASKDYAKAVYAAFVEELVRHGTFHSVIFATIHTAATNILFQMLQHRGLRSFVGRVNMDRNSPPFLCETTDASLYETERYLEEHSGASNVRPILTPRFAPTCSRELLYGLGRLAQKYQCGMQTHLVESRWEAAEALRLFPECTSDAEIYEKAGLLDGAPSVFAHTIFPTKEDIRIIRKHGCTAVHCPDATTNVIAGIMPFAALQQQGVPIALGSDIGAGHAAAIYKQVARAVQLSKLKEFYEPEENRTISFANAFYAATKEGGRIFGKVGSFEKGYTFDAIVIDGLEDRGLPLSAAQRLERFCYTGDDRNIVARYLNGKPIR